MTGFLASLLRNNDQIDLWLSRTLLTIAIAGSLILKLFYVKENFLWLDESVQLFFSHKDLPSLFKLLILSDTHPPGYYLITKIWVAIGGIDLVWIRLLGIFISTATVFVFYRYLRINYSRLSSSFGSFFLAFAPSFFASSLMFRGFHLLILGAILLDYSFQKIKYSPSKKHLISLAAGVLCLSWTHVSGSLYLFLYLFFVLLPETKKTNIKKFTPGLLVIFILSLIPTYFFIHQYQCCAHMTHWIFEKNFSTQVQFFISYIVSPDAVITTIFVFSIIIVTLLKRTNMKWPWIGLFALISLPISYSLISQLISPLFIKRYFIISIFGLSILLTHLIDSLQKRVVIQKFFLFLFLTLIAFNLSSYRDNYFSDEWHTLVEKDAFQENIPIFICSQRAELYTLKVLLNEQGHDGQSAQFLKGCYADKKLSEIPDKKFYFVYSGPDWEHIQYQLISNHSEDPIFKENQLRVGIFTK